MTEQRRRLDTVLDPEYTASLSSDPMEVLSEKRSIVGQIENELSYYRRLLHGRLDLLRFEQARRRGEESRSLIEALPELLAGGLTGPAGENGNPLGRLRGDFVPEFPEVERRFSRITDDDFLIRLPELTDDDLAQIHTELEEIEQDVSGTRSQLHEVHDAILAELAVRFQAADSA